MNVNYAPRNAHSAGPERFTTAGVNLIGTAGLVRMFTESVCLAKCEPVAFDG